jgi:hypothetical protein
LNLIGIPVNIDLLLFGCDVNSITHNDWTFQLEVQRGKSPKLCRLFFFLQFLITPSNSY